MLGVLAGLGFVGFFVLLGLIALIGKWLGEQAWTEKALDVLIRLALVAAAIGGIVLTIFAIVLDNDEMGILGVLLVFLSGVFLVMYMRA